MSSKATKIGTVRRLSDDEVESWVEDILSRGSFDVTRKSFFLGSTRFNVAASDLTSQEREQKRIELRERFSDPFNYGITWEKGLDTDFGQGIDEFPYELETESCKRPVLVADSYWLFKYTLYEAPLDLESEEVLLLIKEIEIKKARKFEGLRKLVAASDSVGQASERKPIPEDVQMFVWRRDEAKCVKCDSQENLEFDHIIPVSKGGANTARNIQLLCEICNRAKSDKI